MTPHVAEVVGARERTEADMRADAEETLNRCAWDTKAKRHARDVLALLERLAVCEPKAED